MNKKTLTIALALSTILGSTANASYNKYNDESYINTTNLTMEESAKLQETTFEELKANFELPEDMAADTNEAAAFYNLTLKNYAKLLNISTEELVKQISDIVEEGCEIDETTKWGEAEGHILLKNYIENGDLEKFKQAYGLSDEINEKTTVGEVKIQVARAEIANLGILSYLKEDVNAILVMLNGKYVDFDVAPYIKDSRTMVPVRGIFEKLGATVDWDGETKTVFIVSGDKNIALQIGGNVLFVNNEKFFLDAPAEIIDGRTAIPLRAIAEALETQVFFNEDTKTVVIH